MFYGGFKMNELPVQADIAPLLDRYGLQIKSEDENQITIGHLPGALGRSDQEELHGALLRLTSKKIVFKSF